MTLATKTTGRGELRLVGEQPSGLCNPSPTGAHYWDIESANGTTSNGTCRYCRSVRSFYNWFEFKTEGYAHIGGDIR